MTTLTTHRLEKHRRRAEITPPPTTAKDDPIFYSIFHDPRRDVDRRMTRTGLHVLDSESSVQVLRLILPRCRELNLIPRNQK